MIPKRERPESDLPTPARVAVATIAALVGAVPTLLSAPEDRALAMGLPAIVLAVGYILGRIDDRDREYTVDLVCAGLLACPGLAVHGWLRLRALDASAWYFPEQRILGVLEQAGEGGATAGILWGSAVALAALRGRRAIPLVAGLVAAGAWIGAGSLSVALLIEHLHTEPPGWLLLFAAVTVEWGAGAVLGGLLAVVAGRGCASVRERVASVVIGAALTAGCTVPVGLLAETLELNTIQGPLPVAPVGPRTIAPIYQPGGTPSADGLRTLLAAHGHPENRSAWTPREYPRAPWHRGLRMGVVVVLPPDAPRSQLDALVGAAWERNTLRLALPGRAEGLPPGLVDQLLGFPTADLLLDPAPSGSASGLVHADGSVDWADTPPTASPPPHCTLRADPDVTVGVLTTVAFRLSDRTASVRCRGIGYPPATCQPGGSGGDHCPTAH